MKDQRQKKSTGSHIVYGLVSIADIMTAVLLLWLLDSIDFVKMPVCIEQNMSVVSMLCVATAIVAVAFNGTIIHKRLVKSVEVILRVLRLVITHVLLLMIFLRMEYAGDTGVIKFMIGYGILYFALLLVSRFCEKMLINHLRMIGHNSRRVVFVGSDPANLMLYHEMLSDASVGYVVDGYYSDDVIVDAPAEFVRIGTRTGLTEALLRGEEPFHCDEMYCSLSHANVDTINALMHYCDKHVIQFYYVPRIYGNLSMNLTPVTFGQYTLFTNYTNNINRLDNRIVKRTFDIFVSGMVCLCMLPFLPFICLMIKIQSPGPVLFKQDRTGLNGETFKCLKFRSMHVNDDADKVQATKNDPRKFPFGEFMRKTNIDEFPQFFNVLFGDMSIVGPRPHMLLHTDMYSKLIEKYMVRHFSKPGITGWAQVTGFRGETKEVWQMEERIKRDIWYNENWSFALDIEIIFRTAWSIIHPDKNAY